MWGTMVGFGDLHYRYASGHEGDTFLLGFASRKPDLTLYLGACFAAETPELDAPASTSAAKAASTSADSKTSISPPCADCSRPR